MRVSGYDEGYRYDIIKGAIERHRTIIDQARDGQIMFYRNRNQIIQSKKEKGGNSASSWHLKGETTSTLNVAATPGGALKLCLSSALSDYRASNGGKTMVIERGGRPILGGLEKKDPFQKSGCKYGEGCLAEEGVDCSKVGICYEIRCTMCDENDKGGPNIGPQAKRLGG